MVTLKWTITGIVLILFVTIYTVLYVQGYNLLSELEKYIKSSPHDPLISMTIYSLLILVGSAFILMKASK